MLKNKKTIMITGILVVLLGTIGVSYLAYGLSNEVEAIIDKLIERMVRQNQ